MGESGRDIYRSIDFNGISGLVFVRTVTVIRYVSTIAGDDVARLLGDIDLWCKIWEFSKSCPIQSPSQSDNVVQEMSKVFESPKIVNFG